MFLAMPSADTGITSTVWRISGVSVRYLSFMKSIWLVIFCSFGWASVWQFWPGPWLMRSYSERQRGLDSNRGPILWRLWVMSYLCPCPFQPGRVFLLQVWRGNLATEKPFFVSESFFHEVLCLASMQAHLLFKRLSNGHGGIAVFGTSMLAQSFGSRRLLLG